ncbi:MAG: PspC domain-containing protein [Bacteroidaceae bacterium]|nr:PspC domain-containing protein [Bacteroidaceae bacterium]
MNEIKKCSISGIAFVFEKVAYNRLSVYIDSLKRAYKDNPESDEIIADIEARIAELILSAQSDQTQTVCLPLVENIIAQLGSAEDITGDEDTVPTTDTRIARRLYRDMENSKLGGVCSGLGKYLNIDPVLIRLAIFSPLILIPISNISHYIYWLNPLGTNIFWVFIATYVIMWFVVPQAVSARQKLEMEGEAVTAKAIADRQKDATDEQRAKSTLATFIGSLGKIAIVCLKAFVAIAIFVMIFFCIGLIAAFIAMATGIGTTLIQAGNLGTLADVITTFGTGLPLFAVCVVLVPTMVIIYLLASLVLGSKPRGWVLLCSLIVWILFIIGIFTTAHNVVINMHEDEIERILKHDWDDARIAEPLDSLEYNRLLNDPNAESID